MFFKTKAPAGANNYACTATNTWTPTQDAGTTGLRGYSPQYIVADGAPSGATGNNGDMYINSATSDVYGPKASGAWSVIVANIKGTTGATGATGYTPAFIVAAGAPSVGAGNNSDMYINSTTGDVYG